MGRPIKKQFLDFNVPSTTQNIGKKKILFFSFLNRPKETLERKKEK